MKKEPSALDILKQISQQKGAEITQAAKAAGEKVKVAASVVNDSVHKQPWYYMGGAAVVGFLAGIFAHAKRKSSEP